MDTSLLEHLIIIRRKIHSNPELGYREFETADLICNELERCDVPYRRNVAVTGVIAEIKYGDGPCIVLRADMDALPMPETENTNLPFASKKHIEFRNKTVPLMHACGHDLHTTILLGAIHNLKKETFQGTVKFIFQPSEEGTYGELFDNKEFNSGGERIVDSGELKNVKAAIGLHVHPLLPTGKIAFCKGQAMAAVSFFKIIIKGKPGHAAFPEKTIDPIIIASQLILSAQNIVSRYTTPQQPKVISFTQIDGGDNENVIPGRVTLHGTIRALDKATFEEIIQFLKTNIEGLKIMTRAEIEIEFSLNYPSLLNDENIHEMLKPSLEKTFGKENILEQTPMMGGEDFAFYSRKVPSFFYFLGANNGDNKYFVHHPQVVFDEKCIKFGSEFLSNATLQLLNKLA